MRGMATRSKSLIGGLVVLLSTALWGQDPDPEAAAPEQLAPVVEEAAPVVEEAAPVVEERGASQVPAGQELVNLDFPEPTDIQDIIKAVAVWTGKNVILDRNVTGKVQIISPRKVTKEEAYQTFLSALNLLDLTTVETGKVIKIMKVRNAVRDNLTTYQGASWAPSTDKIITQIIPLKYIDAKQIQSTLSRIVSSNSMISYDPTNTLIVSDSGYKVKRILEIIELLDVQTQQPKVWMVPIRYSDAKGVADKVNQIIASSGKGKGASGYQSFKILTDERTNSVIIFGPPRTIKDVKELVKKFDIPLDDPSAQAAIHVRPLQYADAKKLSATLSSLAAGTQAGGRRTPPRKGQEEGGVAELSEGVKITADEATNALLITGSKAAYNALNTIIRKLDVRRSQVFVEADILDISEKGGFKFGTSIFAAVGGKLPVGWESAKVAPLISATAVDANDKPIIGSASQSLKGVADTFSTEMNVGILSGGSIDIPGLGTVKPGFLINMIKTDANSKILGSPHILTSNNEEASMTVGQRVVYLSAVTTATGVVNQKPEKEDVDLTLTIKPNISYSNYVTLNVKLESSKILTISPAGLPETARRKTSQIVTVKNGQTIVISGLVSNEERETYRKIPLLGDIPVLGWLFRNSEVSNERNNLVIFLTPHIVHGANDLAAIYKAKVKERDEYFEEIFGSGYTDTAFYKRLPKQEDGEYRPTKADESEDKHMQLQQEELYKAMGLDEAGVPAEVPTPEVKDRSLEEGVTVPVPLDESSSGGGGFETGVPPPPEPSISPEPPVIEEPPLPPLDEEDIE
ncbi:MAG: type II secretion system secretin GspD [Deltaproteobacteria bacterium]|nr:type II secretion system secretin GspD [Deltaproteobacteria bacterium]